MKIELTLGLHKETFSLGNLNLVHFIPKKTIISKTAFKSTGYLFATKDTITIVKTIIKSHIGTLTIARMIIGVNWIISFSSVKQLFWNVLECLRKIPGKSTVKSFLRKVAGFSQKRKRSCSRRSQHIFLNTSP